MDNRSLGILGGGQLGRMMIESANRLGLKYSVLDPGGSSSPAGQVGQLTIEGSFTDPAKIQEIASISDIITTEIEHVDANTLEALEKEGKMVRPNANTLQIIQDKYIQKVHLSERGIPLPDFMDTPTEEEVKLAGTIYGYPFMLKKRKLAYDGRGNFVIKKEDDISLAFHTLGGNEIYAEKWIPFVKELAVMVARTITGLVSYPVVETVQKDNICHVVTAPAQISSVARVSASVAARQAIESFSGIGIYGVEMFLLSDDTVVVNEIAPRPHNSGHYTIEACNISQFEMHLRAIYDLPCPKPEMVVGVAIMINILGGETMEETKSLLTKALDIPGAGVHWYGKSENRVGRKMAHVTVTADNVGALKEKLHNIGIPPEVHGLPVQGPRVGIIMGSDSDLPTMKDAADILSHFNVTFECTIVSAHRTPARMYTYAQSAAERGIQVIIAGAGGAAHLPGMVAALTPLPVIGVPVKTSTLSGNDSLLSIVQMPKGVPVATVAIGNAANAGLLAVRVLGAQDEELRSRMEQFLGEQEEEVLRKAARLELVGYKDYLEGNFMK